MQKPITPKEAKERAGEHIPPEVIEIFNGLIAENLHGKASTFTGKEAQERIKQWCSVNEKQYDASWLNIEPVFRRAGWKVEGDWPGFNEQYDGSWTFIAK